MPNLKVLSEYELSHIRASAPDCGKTKTLAKCLKDAYVCVLFHQSYRARTRRCEVYVCFIDEYDPLEV